MKKIILIIMLFTGSVFAQSNLLLLLGGNYPPTGFAYFKTSDGERFRTVTVGYFYVPLTILFFPVNINELFVNNCKNKRYIV